MRPSSGLALFASLSMYASAIPAEAHRYASFSHPNCAVIDQKIAALASILPGEWRFSGEETENWGATSSRSGAYYDNLCNHTYYLSSKIEIRTGVDAFNGGYAGSYAGDGTRGYTEARMEGMRCDPLPEPAQSRGRVTIVPTIEQPNAGNNNHCGLVLEATIVYADGDVASFFFQLKDSRTLTRIDRDGGGERTYLKVN